MTKGKAHDNPKAKVSLGWMLILNNVSNNRFIIFIYLLLLLFITYCLYVFPRPIYASAFPLAISQLPFTSSKSRIKTPEKGVKYVQSQQ